MPSNSSVYYLSLVTFYEDDILLSCIGEGSGKEEVFRICGVYGLLNSFFLDPASPGKGQANRQEESLKQCFKRVRSPGKYLVLKQLNGLDTEKSN
jgi:hypothetical protein